MIRKIIHIDRDKCDGCGQCVDACHEGAIQLIDGKAELVSDVYCDGLGDCIGSCPMDAIRIEEREADAFDPAAVSARLGEEAESAASGSGSCPTGACPGLRAFRIFAGDAPETAPETSPAAPAAAAETAAARPSAAVRLTHWPVQLHLVPVQAPWWDGADLLLAADCVLAAYPEFRETLLAGRVLVMACPKLDDTGPYIDKLAAILSTNRIRSLTVARMTVPCCGGLVRIIEEACARAGWDKPTDIKVIEPDGSVVNQ
jgi:NAD-dependent dihydropyrimidine dehydrogenase PreA subunit